jgi:hypothetical protein
MQTFRVLLVLAALGVACGSSSGTDGGTGSVTYTIGGFFSTVPGVNSGLVLATPGEPNLVNPPQPFTFATPVTAGTAYNVTVATQPSNGTCTVLDGGVGTVGTSNVTNVEVGCAIELP